MDMETYELYNTVISIADKIDKSLPADKKPEGSVRELFRMDMRDFLIFLTVADKTIAKDEIRYINNSLKYTFDYETMKNFAVNSNIMKDDYLNDPPKSMKYFLTYASEEFYVGQAKYYDMRKLYVIVFQMVGEDFLSNCKHMELAEVNQLTRYRFMLESQTSLFMKNGGKKVERPDSIPFKLKSKEQKTEETDGEKETETTFIGTVTEGDLTKDDLPALLSELDSLTGLTSVKEEVHNLINLLKIIELRVSHGLKAPSVTKHFVFTGNPGTGKTTVARLLSRIYCALGILSKGHMVEVDRSGMVAGYMGQTAIKVKEVVDKALGGVLFIDEAYSLLPKSDSGNADFGQEAIDTLVKAMEDNRDDLIVIVAGYPDLMEDFIDSNPGLKSRFQKTIDFPDYNADELYEIFVHNCEANDYKLSDDAILVLKEKLEDLVANKTENFGNARDVRNLIDNAISVQANRLLTENNLTPDELTLFTKEDIEAIF